MSSGAREQRREPGDKVVGLEQLVSGAVSEHALVLKHYQPIPIKAQALLCDGASGQLAAHAFELGPFMRFTDDGAVERKSIAPGGQWLGSSAAALHRQQWVLQPHRGAPGLRASGDSRWSHYPAKSMILINSLKRTCSPE